MKIKITILSTRFSHYPVNYLQEMVVDDIFDGFKLVNILTKEYHVPEHLIKWETIHNEAYNDKHNENNS